MDDLVERRSAIEREQLEITQELLRPLPGGQPPVGLKGNLVDKDGFPRADVDLMRVTALRNRLAVLNTDFAAVMKEIDGALVALHASPPAEAPPPAALPYGKALRAELKPFAEVAEVFAGSPAAACGLKAGDKVLLLGHLDKAQVATRGFASLAAVVSPGITLKVYIEPADGKGRKTVFLTPGPWSGQGMLGCRLVQIS